jgi:hypothetical protein
MGLCTLMDSEDECVTSGEEVNVHVLEPCDLIEVLSELPYLMRFIAIDHATEETVETETCAVVVDTHEGMSSV